MLQPPQLAGSLSTGFSQPFSLFPSQSAKFALHWGLHWLPTQLLVVTCAAALMSQTLLHPPHAVRVELVSVSQPLNRLVSQSPKFAAHAGLHALAEQVLLDTCAPADSSQPLPQPPQLALSEEVSVVHPFCGLEHARNVPVHVGRQVPMLQLVLLALVVAHAVVQTPQWFLSVLRLASQPSPRSVLQLSKLAAQLSNAHPLDWQCAVALA
jgi:hypothetical protein